MYEDLRKDYVKVYRDNYHYKKTIKDLIGDKDITNALKKGIDFKLRDRLLYYIIYNGTRKLYILRAI